MTRSAIVLLLLAATASCKKSKPEAAPEKGATSVTEHHDEKGAHDETERSGGNRHDTADKQPIIFFHGWGLGAGKRCWFYDRPRAAQGAIFVMAAGDSDFLWPCA